MADKMIIETDENIEKIMEKNLDEKSVQQVMEIKSCSKCRFYDKPWIWGRTLHCCSQDSDNVKTSRDINDLYEFCPIDHKIETTKTSIKRYGIIHEKPDEDSYYDKRGCIMIVDFKGTSFESDGYNPDVEWEPVVIFYYNNQEEADKMMKLAWDYYNEFNLDDEYVAKICYG